MEAGEAGVATGVGADAESEPTAEPVEAKSEDGLPKRTVSGLRLSVRAP